MPAALPVGFYAPSPPPHPVELVVHFQGEDGRTRAFDVAQCPLPGWHKASAAVLAARIGPGGGLRTLASASSAWRHLRRFLTFLAQLREGPCAPAQLRLEHTAAFRADCVGRVGPVYGGREMDMVWQLLRLEPLASQIPAEVLDSMRMRVDQAAPSGIGYSDREVRQILVAARRAVGAIRARIEANESLLNRLGSEPTSLTDDEREHAMLVRRIAEQGIAPPQRDELGRISRQDNARRQWEAEQLFVTVRDVPPILVLLMALSGRNVETLKELPSRHRLLEQRAVELRLTKRRRGAGNWSQTVAWEIGPAHRALHTPGGLYLLLHRLMARGRAAADDPESFWVFWRNLIHRVSVTRTELGNPFREDLQGSQVRGAQWTGHGVLDDNGGPLTVRFPQLRISIERQRTRQLGGHLPSTARSNTVPVLFSNYLRGDPATVDWAREVTATALADAEAAALAAHRRALADQGGILTVVGGDAAAAGLADVPGTQQGAWSACRDIEHHPGTGKPCRATFLDCFQCGNCVITAEHLPRLLALLSALTARRAQMSDQHWWARYGPAWAAIRHDVLSRFTPAERAHAQNLAVPDDALLDLLEHPWERP